MPARPHVRRPARVPRRPHTARDRQDPRRPRHAAATAVPHSTVVLAGTSAGEPKPERLPVLGPDPDVTPRVLDPGGTRGDPARLRRPDTVALGADRARSLGAHPGSTVRLRFGDGAAHRLRVVAVHRRALALGDVLLGTGTLAPI